MFGDNVRVPQSIEKGSFVGRHKKALGRRSLLTSSIHHPITFFLDVDSLQPKIKNSHIKYAVTVFEYYRPGKEMIPGFRQGMLTLPSFRSDIEIEGLASYQN